MLMKKTLLTCAIMLVVSLGTIGCTPNTSSNDLAMFRGNAQHTGYLPTTGPHELHGIKWTFPTEGRIRSTPIYYDHAVYFGSEDHNMYAVNAETGAQIWKFPTEGPVLATPALMNGTVYFLSGDGTFYVVEANSGQLLWSFLTEEENNARDDYDYWQSSPAIQDGIIYFGGGGGDLYALDIETGQLSWKHTLHFQNPDTYKDYPVTVHSSPAVANGVVYVGISGIIHELRTEPGNVIALDAKTGEELWASKLMQAVDSSPAVDDHAVYFSMRNYAFAAVDSQTGELLWRNFDVKYSLSSPAIYNGTVYTGSSDQRQLLAIDAISGKSKWIYTAPGVIHTSPISDGTMIYFGTGNNYSEDNGYITALQIETGEEVWRLETNGNIFSSPMIHDGVLYVGNDDCNLYAVY